MKSSSQASIRSLSRSALIAALYVLLTLIFQPISFGPVQFRIAEALMLLPVLAADAVPGLFIGCLLANLLGGGIWYDVMLGSLASLLAAIFARKFRNHCVLAAAMPVVFNALIVGPVVYFGYVHPIGTPTNWGVLLSSAATVGLGELVVCYAMGLPMVHVLRRLPQELLTGRFD